MLFDTSVNDKEIKFKINKEVGKPFSFMESIKRAPIGSSRMEVIAYSKLFNGVMAWNKQAIFGNIALRPHGILVIISVRLSNYSWVIPYRNLSIFHTETLTIHSQGEFIRFKVSPSQNKKIIQRIISEKNAHTQQNMDYHGGVRS